jgi:asparagine synthase (glutamine-hydrolysing)
MCGIAGYILRAPVAHGALSERLLGPIRLRGPDDEGACLIVEGRAVAHRTPRSIPAVGDRPLLGGAVAPHTHALLHTRYSIIDLSPAGHQPFASRDGTLQLVFNGEIFNYVELRAELERAGACFRSATDTEVILEGYRVWGDDVWNRLNGFWAVALYDGRTGSLVLCRDRLGVAPLYYRETEQGFFFASAIRSLTELDGVPAHFDVDRVRGFIDTSIKDFDDATMFSDIRCVPPATSVTLRPGEYRLQQAAATRYWAPPAARLDSRDLGLDEAVRRLRDALFGAVEIRLRADVPVAFELSGGMDSSSVVAIAALLRGRDVRTYTIRVPEANEEPYARAMTRRYPIDYHVLERPEAGFFEDVGEFTRMMEEPYHSPNIYTHYQMRWAMKREGVAVVLAGAGGDEVLAGYEGDFWPAAWRDLRREGHVLQGLRYELARRTGSATRLRGAAQDAYWAVRGQLFRTAKRLGAHRLLGRDGERRSTSAAATMQRGYRSLDFHGQALYHVRRALLPYYLRSNDHFTMAIPMEHRFPLLDYRVVEVGLQMPAAYLFRDGWTKYALRRAMEPYLPAEIVWRRDKMGFPFPYQRFLRENRARLAPPLAALRSVGIEPESIRYDALAGANPTRLWRMCSTALWLESVVPRG